MALDIHKKAVTKQKSKRRFSFQPDVTPEIVNSKYINDPLQLLGEKSFGSPKDILDDEIGTPIQEFFRGSTIFITGGTGFMGKVLTEKLLRCCPHIKHIYLLIRPKKGVDIQERLQKTYNDRLFWRLRTEFPNFLKKISAIAGDCSITDLGINETDRELLTKTVDIVINGAATVRFDEHIKLAIQINVMAVQSMLKLARDMKKLKAFVHVSTAYGHCPRLDIDEQFYPIPVKYENIIKLVHETDEDTLTEMTPKILNEWPNTYTFTKALAEDVVKFEGKGLPLAVCRPGIIISTYREPVRGWIDNVYGPVGMMVGMGTGVLHTSLIDIHKVTDMVPVDLVVNCIIASAWSIKSKAEPVQAIESEKKTIEDEENSENSEGPEIFNFISTAQNPITWHEFIVKCEKHGLQWPTIRAVWYFSFWPTKYKLPFIILNFLLHTIPGFFLDLLATLFGQEPILSKVYSKMAKASDTLDYFARRTWNWKDTNVQKLFHRLTPEDQDLFFFDMGQMSWEYQTEALCLGLRVYLIEDDIETLPAARRKWQRLWIAHCILKIVSVLVVLKFFLFFLDLIIP
nr:alcohol forming fatty acyl CoA reductase [Paurocephala sauteri]